MKDFIYFVKLLVGCHADIKIFKPLMEIFMLKYVSHFIPDLLDILIYVIIKIQRDVLILAE